MSITEQSPLSAGVFQRGSAAKVWFDVSPPMQQDPLVALKERFEEYGMKLTEFDALAAEHVYQNPNFSLLDARQHRLSLYYYLCKGEELALDFELLKREEETAPFVDSLEVQIHRLQKVFEEWHGAAENDPGIPGSFKEAMRDVKAGRTVDMEADLFAADASPEA